MGKNRKVREQPLLFASRFEFVLAISLGAFNLLLLAALLLLFPKASVVLLALLTVLVYLAEIAAIGLRRISTRASISSEEFVDLTNENSFGVFRSTSMPVLTLDSFGTILWYNTAFSSILAEGENLVGSNIATVLGADSTPEKLTGARMIPFSDRMFRAECFSVDDKGEGLYVLVLNEQTALVNTQKQLDDEQVVIGYIAIDNIEDVLQYVHEKFRDAIAEVDERLKSWVNSAGGVIKSYDNEKYIFLLSRASMEDCIKSRFSILDDIRATRVGDGISVTVSIGISSFGSSMAEREIAAREAIDMALQRGGDQAVIYTEEGTSYFGGRTKSIYKRSNVRSRTFMTQLTSKMARADNVLIMGHKYGDFDSFGASVGVARLAMTVGVKTNIAIDLRDKNLLPCIEMMQQTQPYAQMFVDNATGLDLISADTLLVVVDHNAVGRSQFTDIADKVRHIVMIDHHRKIGDLPDSVEIDYIEPSASSTCELVTEMLQSTSSSCNLLKQEADILLSGILLDTKQFTRNTGTRTFAAAEYLRAAGASPTDVFSLFKTDPKELTKEARFHTEITVYRDNIAISCCDGDTDASYRVIASKAADQMLELKGIEAAFTLVRIGEQVHISGRSSGKINVQLILERLHGGGHFDMAGAQVVSDSTLKVLEELKESIDQYLDN